MQRETQKIKPEPRSFYAVFVNPNGLLSVSDDKIGGEMKANLAIFENFEIRRMYDEEKEKWFFSVIDIIQVLIQQPDYQAARNYWKVLRK